MWPKINGQIFCAIAMACKMECRCARCGVDVKRKKCRLKCKQWSSGWELCLLTFIQIIFEMSILWPVWCAIVLPCSSRLYAQLKRTTTFLCRMKSIIYGTEKSVPHHCCHFTRVYKCTVTKRTSNIEKLFMQSHRNMFECALFHWEWVLALEGL